MRVTNLPLFHIAVRAGLIGLVVCGTCTPPPHAAGLKVVSLSPATTEIIYALGAEDRLAAVTTFCDYPPEAQQKNKVGDFSNPSLERIVGLKPDLVVVNLPEHRRIKHQLEELDIKVYASSPTSLEDIYHDIGELGRLTNKTREADSLIEYMRTCLVPVHAKKRMRVFIELADRPIVTIGSSSYLNELITRAGGENIFSDLNKDYPVVAQEEIIHRNPDVIIVLHPGDISGRVGWKDVTAVKENRIYTYLNQDHLMRPGPRLVLGYAELKKVIHD